MPPSRPSRIGLAVAAEITIQGKTYRLTPAPLCRPGDGPYRLWRPTDEREPEKQFYTLETDPDGWPRCSCEAFTFCPREPVKTCKHLDALRSLFLLW